MGSRVSVFAIVTLAPVALLVLGSVAGGGWIFGAVVYLTVFTFVVDEMARFEHAPGAVAREFPAADGLLVVLGCLHLVLLGLAVWVVSGGGGHSVVERVAAFYGFGLFFGQVSNAAAHELIHRGHRGLFRLGKWMFISHLFGHHVSAHRLVHHRCVGTGQDPNSAPLSMGIYQFVWRAWGGSFRAGWQAENRQNAAAWRPYGEYLMGGSLMLALAYLLGGTGGVWAYAGLAGYAALQILLSDYVQHYGLVRRELPDGRIEPVGVRHSWNAPQRFSAFLMLNAPRHSDHHGHPARPFPALGLESGYPVLPHSLAVMGVIAFWPPAWRRLMDGRVREVQKL